MNTRRRAPAARASSTAYWISGLSTTGSISFGLALVAGRKRVPRPATGNTAVRMADLKVVLIGIPSRGPYGSLLGALGPLEDRRPHAVPGAAFRAAPVPANAVEAAIIALVAAAGVADAGQQRTERARLGSRLHARAELRGNARKRGHIRRRHRRGEQPCQLPRGDLTALSQPTAQLIQHIHAAGLARDGENRGNDLEREARRHFQGMQVQQQCAAGIARPLADPRGEDVRARQRRLMSAGLAQQRARALAVALHQRVFGELAQVVSRNPAALELHGGGQLVKHLERLGPVALGLVDTHQVVERGVPILTRGRELLEDALGAIHESRALVVERQFERRLVAQPGAAVIAQARMDGDRPIDFPAAPEQAPQRELNLGGIATRLGHAGEDLRGVIETVVDEMVEADVIVARQAHGARGAVTAAEKICGETDEYEGQRQEQWRQLEHLADDIRSAPRLRLARETRSSSVADRPVGAVVYPLAQILAGLARERDRLAGLGVAPLAGRTEMQRETAEAADLDALPLRERIAHDLQDLLECELDILRRQMLLLGGNDLDEFRLGHALSALRNRCAPSAGPRGSCPKAPPPSGSSAPPRPPREPPWP